MDIIQPPRGVEVNSPEMQRFLQDTYNGVKCPTFKAYMTSNIGMTRGSSWNAFPLNQVVHNELNGWSTSSYKFTPKVPGYYSLFGAALVQLYVNVPTSTDPLHTGILVSRPQSSITRSTVCINSYYLTVGTGINNMVKMFNTAVVYLNGLDDYVEYAYMNELASASDVDIGCFGDAPYTYFQGFKITY